VFVGLSYAAITEWSAVTAYFDDPDIFTGRGAIWQVLIASARDHPLQGVGYGSFWNIGSLTPATDYSRDIWVALNVQGHNGYLDALAQIGLVGLALMVIALVIVPLRQLLATDGQDDVRLRGYLFSMLTFVVFYNVTETVFLRQDKPIWVMFLVVLAVLRQPDVHAPARQVRPMRSVVGRAGMRRQWAAMASESSRTPEHPALTRAQAVYE
jgi:O-antigen ligase